jgi:outer membrane protein TolC
MRTRFPSGAAALLARLWPVALALPLFASSAAAQVSLYTAVDLALRNSTEVRTAQADLTRAHAAYHESRQVFIPNVVFGSSEGYSYGFPLGQPTVFNVTSQSLLYSGAQFDYIRSARVAIQSAESSLRDAREQVVLEAATAYIQLDTYLRQLHALDQEQESAEKLVAIAGQRFDAGLDSRITLDQARLMAAQVRLKHLHVEDQAEDQRQRLEHLTGLPGAGLTTEPASIPPTIRVETIPTRQQIAATPGVAAAFSAADSKQYVARGGHREVYRPQIGFAFQYALFAVQFNNYDNYYNNNLQPNNFGVGVQISWPLFDAAKSARARQSDADALRAKIQAEQALNQTSEQVLQLSRSTGELEMQAEVARLRNDLARDQLEGIETQLASSASTSALTPRDEQQARIDERQRFEDSLDAQFELTRARLTLLRSLGHLEDWARLLPRN